jgi:hypothetical protein
MLIFIYIQYIRRDISFWQFLEKIFKVKMENYNFKEIKLLGRMHAKEQHFKPKRGHRGLG